MTQTPQPEPRQPDARESGSRGNPALGLALGILAGVLLTVLGYFALVDEDDTTAQPAPTPSVTTPAPAPTTPVPSVTPSATTSSPTPTPSGTDSATPSPTPSPTPSDSPAPTPSQDPRIVRELPVGSWVTVLDSLRQEGTTPDQAVQRAQQLSREGHAAVVLDAGAVGLTKGYYAIVIPGQTSRAESNAVCRAIGVPLGEKCYPREIRG